MVNGSYFCPRLLPSTNVIEHIKLCIGCQNFSASYRKRISVSQRTNKFSQSSATRDITRSSFESIFDDPAMTDINPCAAFRNASAIVAPWASIPRSDGCSRISKGGSIWLKPTFCRLSVSVPLNKALMFWVQHQLVFRRRWFLLKSIESK